MSVSALKYVVSRTINETEMWTIDKSIATMLNLNLITLLWLCKRILFVLGNIH